MKALAKLLEHQTRVIELSFYHEVANAEIAERLRIPLGTVKSHLRLVMNKLHSLFGELPWKWIAPRIHMRPLNVPDADETRVFLLEAETEMKLLPHARTGLEMT